MKAAVLEDIEKMVVRDISDPELGPRDVVLRVQAVGVCGTDLHGDTATTTWMPKAVLFP